MSAARDDFYVGYLPDAPPALGRWVRGRVLALLLLAAGVAGVLAAVQSPFSTAVFEFGRATALEGWIEAAPYPCLLVQRPGGAGVSRYLLVSEGKHGAAEAVAGFDGRRVRLDGTLVHYGGQTMVELAAGTLAEVPGADAAGPVGASGVERLGVHTLRGEIVDSKCYLGVMKPGHLKPHRACAVRCISGGIPPVLMMRDEEGRAAYALLASEAGETVNRELLDLVAEPVEITGRLERRDGQLVLYADPRTYVRLP